MLRWFQEITTNTIPLIGFYLIFRYAAPILLNPNEAKEEAKAAEAKRQEATQISSTFVLASPAFNLRHREFLADRGSIRSKTLPRQLCLS